MGYMQGWKKKKKKKKKEAEREDITEMGREETRGRYHGGRRPSSDYSFHSPTSTIGTRQTQYPEALPSSANSEVRCDCTFTMVTLHDTRFVKC